MKRLEDLTEPEIQALLSMMAQQVELVASVVGVERPQFALIVFGDNGIGKYVSNCERAAMVAAILQTAESLKSRQESPRVPSPPEGR